jgi:6-phosphogluconolactonase
VAITGLRGEQVVCATAEACAKELAGALVAHLRQRLDQVARVHVALSGGSSGKLLCEALTGNDVLRASEWARLHVWLVDERCVPDDDPRLNMGLIRGSLGSPAPLPEANLHPMPVLQADGANQYERELRAALAERPHANEQRLDAVVLGMGADGHTASLFPGTAALEERERFIVLNDGERVTPPRPRMTMTFPLLNRARFIALLVTGESKRAVLERLAGAASDDRSLPVARVIPAAGSRLAWFLSDDARGTVVLPPPRQGSVTED